MPAIRLVILGRQGSGKGTQSVRIAETFGCVHVSTGDMLRAAVAEGSDLGQQASAVMEAGGLVSDDIMNGIVAERLAKPDIVANGVLLDGFPRTADQADALESMLSELNSKISMAINLDVPVEEVTKRMMERGRSDDTEAAIRRRLQLYEEQTAPLLRWFDRRGLLKTIDGLGTESEIFDRIKFAINELAN